MRRRAKILVPTINRSWLISILFSEMLDPKISIYSILQDFFGRDTRRLADRYTNELLRNAKIRETLAFNLRCKRTNVIPRTLIQRPPIRSQEGFKIAKQNAMRYLRRYIQEGYDRLRKSNRTHVALKNEVENALPLYLLDYLYETTNLRAKNYRMREKRRLQDKYQKLTGRTQDQQCTENWVLNISSHQLTSAETSLLKKGLNFSLDNSNNSLPQLVACTETAIEKLQIPEAEKIALRYDVTSAIKNSPRPRKLLTKDECEALKALKSNPDIIIAPADKGCSVVVLDKTAYHQKTMAHLDDDKTYKKENSDPSVKFRGKINRFLKDLEHNHVISRYQYEYLFANTSVIPLFYALIKTHKPGHPIRPIVSFIDSPSYNVAKFISKLLTPFTDKSTHKLQNGYDLKHKLKEIKIPGSYKMVSFDVKALFTSIPQDFAQECLKTFLQSNNGIFQKTKLNVDELCEMVSLCFEASFFKFNGTVFRQVTGTPMGSPMSVVIAEIVMQNIEQSIMNLISGDIIFWYRYVDDVITCIRTEAIPTTLNHINSVNENIQFTMEIEENSILNYLDLKIARKDDGTLSYSIFRKPTHTDKYLSFDSNHPLEHKNSVVQSLMHRAFGLCDGESQQQEIEHISDVLQNNGYPKRMVKNFEQKARKKFNKSSNGSQNNSGTEADERKSYISVPYIPGTSERLRKIFRKYNVEVAHRPTRKLRQELCRLKDKRSTDERAGVVYRIECGDCEAKYVGETGRQVKDRMAEHQRDILIKKSASKVYEHVRETGHSFNFDQVSVLDNCSHKKTRLHLECIHTYKEPNSINRSLILNSTYRPIFA